MTTGSKNSVLFTFLSITVFYLFTRWLIFNGFNGTDDLHYAMLASRLPKGGYYPFVPDNIYSGRILIIAVQSLIFWAGGISPLTTQIGTLLASIGSCYLIIFRLLNTRNMTTAFIASCLFYFCLSLMNATGGILPDSYVMLIGILVLLLLRKGAGDPLRQPARPGYYWLAGFLIGAGLLFKESMVLMLPFAYAWLLTANSTSRVRSVFYVTGGFAIAAAIIGGICYHYTGNALFKLTQIQGSSYHNGCDLNSWQDYVQRLTYKPLVSLLALGFFSLAYAMLLLVLKARSMGFRAVFKTDNNRAFALLFLTACFCPMSLHGYQPLCLESRHFIFLLPLAVAVSADELSGRLVSRKADFALAIGALIIFLCAMFGSSLKWQWMSYALLTLLFFCRAIFKKMSHWAFLAVFGMILWLSIVESLFYPPKPWFRELETLSQKINLPAYYFADHSNMMHWELIHHFDDHQRYFNLEKNPFFLFRNYYDSPSRHPFTAGWFIVNSTYTQRSPAFLQQIQELKDSGQFKIESGGEDVIALLIDSPEKLARIRQIME